MLYRDFAPWEGQARERLTEDEIRGWRIAEVVRSGGKDVRREGVPFIIGSSGLREITALKASIEEEKGKRKDVDVGDRAPPPTFPSAVLPSDPPVIEARRENEELIDQAEIEAEANDLGPGFEEEPEPEPEPDPEVPPIPSPKLGAKRKAIEIADSDEEQDLEAESDDEPGLPRILSAREVRDEDDDEMLLDERERCLREDQAW